MSRLKKLGNKKWQIILELGRDRNGKKIRKYKTVNVGQSEAKEIMIRWEADLLDKPHLSNNITLEKHLNEWFDSHSKNIKPLTRESYRQQLDNHLILNLGDIKLSDLNAKVIDDYYDYKLKEGRADGTGGLSTRSVRYLHSILHKALKTALEWDRLIANPADKVHPPKKKDKKANFYVKKEIKKIYDTIDSGFYKDFFEITFRTGMRRGQVLGLQWSSCIDQINNSIVIKQNLQRLDEDGFILQDTTKNNKVYSIPITKKIQKIFDRVKERQEKHKNILEDEYKNDDFIFCNDDGSPKDPDGVTTGINRYIKKAGFEGTLHDLRHSFASNQIQIGTDIKVIQELLGHKSMQTTSDIYTHVPKEIKKDVMNKFDEIL